MEKYGWRIGEALSRADSEAVRHFSTRHLTRDELRHWTDLFEHLAQTEAALRAIQALVT